jgi:hypothetical protein
VTKLAFYITTASVFLFCIAANLNRFLNYVPEYYNVTVAQNVTDSNGTGTALVTVDYTGFYIYYTEFNDSLASRSWTTGAMVFRDFLIITLLLCVSLLILAKMREVTARRVKMVKHATVVHHVIAIAAVVAKDELISTSKKAAGAEVDAPPVTLTTGNAVSTSRFLTVALAAQRRESIMIVLTGFNYILGHIMNVVYTVYFRFVYNSSMDSTLGTWNCITFSAFTLISIVYATPFLFYYFFNTHFKKFFNANLSFVLNPFVEFWKKRAFVLKIKAAMIAESASISASAVKVTQTTNLERSKENRGNLTFSLKTLKS